MTVAGPERRSAPDRPAGGPDEDVSGSTPAPRAPVVPPMVLALADEERFPADELLWDWTRWAHPAPTALLAEPFGPDVDREEWWDPDASGPEPADVVDSEVEAEPVVDLAEAVAPPGGSEPPADQPAATPEPERPSALEPAGPPAEATLLEQSKAEQPAAADDTPLAGPSGLQAWSVQVRRAIGTRIKAPTPADPEGVEMPLRASVAGVRKRETSRRAGAVAAVKKALPKDPALPVELPAPPTIPVEEAETAVAAAVALKLEEQVLPKLQDYTHVPVEGPKAGKPQVFHPRIGLRLPPGTGAVLTPIPPPKPQKQGRKKLAAVKAAGGDVKQGVVVDGAFTLGTVPAPGTPGARPGPPVSKADITGVLVRLRNSIPADAETMLTEVRTGLYPKGSLHWEFRTLGADELLPELRTSITEGIDQLATQAGIDLAELHTATLAADGKLVLQRQQEHEAIGKAGAKARRETEEEVKKSADTDAGARAAAEDAIFEKLRLAEGGASPEQIRDQRDKLVQRVHRRLAPADLRYEREGDERIRALGTMAVAYEAAYTDVARQVAARIEKDAKALAPAAAKASAVTPTPTPTPTPRADRRAGRAATTVRRSGDPSGEVEHRAESRGAPTVRGAAPGGAGNHQGPPRRGRPGPRHRQPAPARVGRPGDRGPRRCLGPDVGPGPQLGQGGPGRGGGLGGGSVGRALR